MSAYFVSDLTIADAVEAMAEAGVKEAKTDAAGFGRKLWQLNALAVFQRYGDATEFEGNMSEAMAFPRPGIGPSENKWQRIKSLACLVYQCSEGDVPDTDLFKQMTRASDTLARKYTDGHPEVLHSRDEYVEADWGR